MPPRYAYWTILIDQKATAFRAREREELLPTLHQLRRKNSDVVMKWFARGRLWDSPEAAQAAQRAPKVPAEKRGRDWRPGGEHRDPRDRFKKGPRAQTEHSNPGRHRDSPGGRPPAASWGSKPPAGPPRNARPWTSKPPAGPTPNGRPWRAKPPTGAAAGPLRSSRPWSENRKGGWRRAPEKEARKGQPETGSTPPSSESGASKPKPPRRG